MNKQTNKQTKTTLSISLFIIENKTDQNKKGLMLRNKFRIQSF